MSANPPLAPAGSSASAAEIAERKDKEIAELHRRGVALQDQHAALQAEHAKLQAQHSASAAKLLRAKTSNPPPFLGEGHTAGAQLDDWLDEVERHIDYMGSAAFPDESGRIRWAALLMRGKAANWWRAHQAELAARNDSIDTWKEFVSALRERFRPIEAATVARTNLDSLRQTHGVQAYIEYFQRQMQLITDMSVPDQLHAFTRGLQPAIRAEVLKSRPTTVSGAINTAFLAESLVRGGHHGHAYARGYGTRTSGASSGAAPMEVSNLNGQAEEWDGHGAGIDPAHSALIARLAEMERSQQQQQQFIAALFQKSGGSGHGSGSGGSSGNRSSGGGTKKVPGISHADYERCRREGRCIKCKKPDHVARDCTNPFSANF